MGEEMTNNQEAIILEELTGLVKLVVEEEGFKTEILPNDFEKYYVSIDHQSGRRCVDGRQPITEYQNEATEYADNNYTGGQFAGGSNGELGALRVVTGLGEDEARGVLTRVCSKRGIRLGNHNDDGHGEIKEKEELSNRTKGCGNQDKLAEGELPMYEDLGINKAIQIARIDWIKEQGGLFPALAGSHEEKGTGINLAGGTTFDTKTAVNEESSIFNLDVRQMYEFAPDIYEELPDEVKRQIKTEDFRKQMVKAVVRDYLQTLKALGGSEIVWLKG